MDKPIIGIAGRPDYSKSNREVTIFYDSVRIMIEKLGGIPIVIPPLEPIFYQQETSHNQERKENKDLEKILNLCDGIVLQGGSLFFDYDIEIATYAKNNNIPILGICLGMQTLACASEGKIKNITTNQEIHQNKERRSHAVTIKKDSKLYSILKQDNIWVNSRHQEEIIKTKLDVVAYATDGKIEAVEDSSKTFFIGVQWHPEDMFEYDIVSKKLLLYFIETCKGEMYEHKRNYKSSERNLL